MCVPLTIHMLYICMAIGSAKALVSAQHHIMCIQTEREALLQFKAALLDPYGMLSSWTTADCCRWEGIRCSNLTGHVLMLHLPGQFHYSYAFNSITVASLRYMRGEIHKSLMELQQLKYLNLSWNDFRGRGIPEFLGSLSNLRYLDLSCSQFGGKIPTQFGSLSHLKHLDLAGNFYLEGSIPRQLGNLSQLQYLDLGGNQFEGKIPSQIGSLSQLQHLDLGDNSLEGNIPSQIGNLSQLQLLNLRFNSLEGSIPSQLGNLSNLQKLYLGRYSDDVGAPKIDDGDHWLSNLISLTHLSLYNISNLNTSHSFLQMIAKLPKLRELRLFDCSLSDHFILSLRPSKFNFSSSLSILDLSVNSFTSSMILQRLSNVTSNLVELDLSDNLLEGSTSNHFGHVMNSLEHLDLSSNIFKGEDLKSFANICTLHSLYMRENHLSEDLPSILHNLSSGCVKHSLQELDLSDNQITGSLTDLSIKLIEGGIPKSFGNSCALSSLDMSGNKLNKELSVIIHQLSGCVRFSLQELNLEGNQIKGTLPDLSIFSVLKTLDLSANQLNGKTPESSKFPSLLESLSIRSNNLEGGIPKSFGNACALRSLDMSNNSLSEEFPMIIHYLSGCARYSLEQLYLGMNQINGTLPDFSIFSILKELDLHGNKLNGEIPKDYKFPPQLKRLDMQSNSLKGVLTDYHFANMSMLYFLELSDNSLLSLAFRQNWVPPFQLSYIGLRSCKLGPVFPKWLETQNQFGDIDISNAGIADMVPKWFWANLAFREEISMNISYNNLHGNRTYDLNALLMWKGSEQMFKNNVILLLKSIDLSSNHFSGEIPLEIENLFELVSLNLSRNHLTGKIPSNIGKLTSLDFLDLSRNHLVGSIPSSLTQIDRLGVLDLSHNNLSGEIPTGTQLQSFNASCYEDNLDLCGPPLEKLCIDGKPAQEPIVKLPEDENLFFTCEFYMSMAIGFVISFCGVFGSILIKRSWRHAYFKFISNLSDAIYVMAAVKVFKWCHRG
ncbi:Receptor-like protein EIX2 [Glycine max]|nr:Receptor-like protein EIX2 [Glycine max]